MCVRYLIHINGYYSFATHTHFVVKLRQRDELRSYRRFLSFLVDKFLCPKSLNGTKSKDVLTSQIFWNGVRCQNLCSRTGRGWSFGGLSTPSWRWWVSWSWEIALHVRQKESFQLVSQAVHARICNFTRSLEGMQCLLISQLYLLASLLQINELSKFWAMLYPGGKTEICCAWEDVQNFQKQTRAQKPHSMESKLILNKTSQPYFYFGNNSRHFSIDTQTWKNSLRTTFVHLFNGPTQSTPHKRR